MVPLEQEPQPIVVLTRKHRITSGRTVYPMSVNQVKFIVK